MKIGKHQLVKTLWKPGLSHGQALQNESSCPMLNSAQFGKPTPPLVKPPKVQSGGSYKMPKLPPVREELDLMEAKANVLNAKAAKIRREG